MIGQRKSRKFSIVPGILATKSIKFYNENNLEVQVAKPESQKYFCPFKEPYIVVDKFANKRTQISNIRNTEDIEELKRLEFCIYSVKPASRFRKGQQVKYVLRKIDDPIYNAKLLGHMPTDHKIQIDTNNKLIRICGKNAGRNGFGRWLKISDGSANGYPKEEENYGDSLLRRLPELTDKLPSIDSMKAELFGASVMDASKRYKKVIIRDIPIMLTPSNEILCIPNTSEIKHVGITGMTGTCKSILLNSILSWNYWQKERNHCVNLNDFQKETFEWSLPADSFLYNASTIKAM